MPRRSFGGEEYERRVGLSLARSTLRVLILGEGRRGALHGWHSDLQHGVAELALQRGNLRYPGRMSDDDADLCPHCGATLPPRAVACRECGSDFETGWSDDVEYESIELPEGTLSETRSPARRTIAILCAIAILACGIPFLGGQLWQILLVVAIGCSLAFGVRRDRPPHR
jgi:hypothetical protein